MTAHGPGKRWARITATLYGLLLLGTLAAFLLLPDTNEPEGCDGIGFGCSLPPNENAVVIGVLAGAVLVPVCAVLGIVLVRAARRGPGPDA